MFVGPIKLFWSQSNPYAGVTPARAITREQTSIQKDHRAPQQDLLHHPREEARLARAAEISLRQIDQLSPLFEPVE